MHRPKRSERRSVRLVVLVLCLFVASATSNPLIGQTAAISGSAAAGGCSDPSSQLSCYCESIGKPVAGPKNLVAACYSPSVQTETFLLFGFFSAYSWTALNWPVSKTNGVPDYSKDLGTEKGDNSTVWESWRTTSEVFLPDGRKPKPWA